VGEGFLTSESVSLKSREFSMLLPTHGAEERNPNFMSIFMVPATVSALPLFRPLERPFGERRSTAAVPTSGMTDSDRDAEIKELSPTCLEGERLAGEMTTPRPVRK
jgi:hypothetical protein